MRPNAQARGYNARWQKASKTYLAQHPYCTMCLQMGHTVRATVVDHIKPHRGDTRLFWDSKGNWQSLCTPHHNSTKQRDEKRGYSSAVGNDGWPIDAMHPANASR